MSTPPSDIDLNFLTELLAQPEQASRARKPKDTRDQETWFHREHIIMGTCSNPKCVSIELGQSRGRNRVTSIVNDHEMCRFCYFYGWHHNPTSP